MLRCRPLDVGSHGRSLSREECEMAKRNAKRTRYEIVLTIETDRPEAEELVEEAVTAVIDEEIMSLRSSGGSRCGLRFVDALNIRARRVLGGQ
jgi:hypothetical protein